MKHPTQPELERNSFITERIRSLCRDGVELAAPRMVAIANGEIEDAAPPTQVRAFIALAQHGLSEPRTVILEQADWVGVIMRITSKYLPDRDAYLEWYKDFVEAINAA